MGAGGSVADGVADMPERANREEVATWAGEAFDEDTFERLVRGRTQTQEGRDLESKSGPTVSREQLTEEYVRYVELMAAAAKNPAAFEDAGL
jgi:hypothetical protein